MRNTLGDKIRAGREVRGLTRERLGSLLGASPRAIQKWESNEALPSSSVLRALSEALGVAEEFFRATPHNKEGSTSRPHVFLSHVREDAERVERLAADLEARGIGTWIDRHKIKPGERWQRAIEDAIRSGAFFLACFSHAYAGKPSSYMNEELHLAAREMRRKPLNASWFIPLRLDDCEIPDWPIGPELSIRSFQWHDMFPDWARSVERLAEAIGPSSRPDHLLEPLAVFRDIDAPWCPEMVVMPTGSFLMGATEAERLWALDRDTHADVSSSGAVRCLFGDEEKPRHKVKIAHRFAVGRYPVTFGEWDFCTHVGGCDGYRPYDEGWGSGRRPVINVSWEDAQAYVEWLSKETGQPYRLLSEAEWEYACRAGTTTHYSWGDEIKLENANYGKKVGKNKTTEVGSYPPNRWGLHDTHGNVCEWVEDCWNDGYEGAPNDGSAWTSDDRSRLVVRGGSWSDRPGLLRSASRIEMSADYESDDIGFRVARTLR